MSARWLVRLIGLAMLIGFLMLLAHLQSRLVEIQRNQRPAATSTR